MIKCTNKGKWTCLSRTGAPKRSYLSADLAIRAAKIVNDKNSELLTKLVAYKCTNCHKYHLVTVNRKIK